MSAIIRISHSISEKIKSINPDETSSIERLTALLAIQIVNYGVIVCCMIIGVITDSFIETVLSVSTFVIMRLVTGGFHFRNLDACFLCSTAALSAIPHISWIPPIIPNSCAVALIGLFSEKKKIVPISILGVNFFLENPIIALASFVQAITLIKLGGENRL